MHLYSSPFSIHGRMVTCIPYGLVAHLILHPPSPCYLPSHGWQKPVCPYSLCPCLFLCNSLIRPKRCMADSDMRDRSFSLSGFLFLPLSSAPTSFRFASLFPAHLVVFFSSSTFSPFPPSSSPPHNIDLPSQHPSFTAHQESKRHHHGDQPSRYF